MVRYKKGESGNPGHRPKGIKDKRVRYREPLEPHVEQLVAKNWCSEVSPVKMH